MKKISVKENAIIIARILVLFCSSMILHWLFDVQDYRYDAAWYWDLGKQIKGSILDLGSGFRGYVYPLFNSFCYRIGMLFGNEYVGLWIGSSITFTFLFTYVYDNIVALLGFDKKSCYVKCSGVVCGGITFLFFRGLFLYPLSDIYTFTLSLCAIIVLNRIVTCEKRVQKCVLAVLLGVILYAAYNIRTIYLFMGIAVVLYTIIYFIYKRRWVEAVLTTGCVLIGVFLCSLPQMMLNHRLEGTFSMAVPTGNLMLAHLYLGMQYARYGTYIGDETMFASAQMLYHDYLGQNILIKEQLYEFSSYTQYFKLVLKYPLDIAGIYVRHFVNMLYPIFPNQYVMSVDGIKSIYILLFYTLIFVSCTTFKCQVQKNGWKWSTIILMMIPCICILPGEVEIRFFIALHFLIYVYAVLTMRDFIVKCKEKWCQYLLMYMIGLLLYIAWGGYMLSGLSEGIVILG